MFKINHDLKFKYACLISLIFGAIVFFIKYVDLSSNNVLNPFYTDWIKNGSIDLKQHFWGWLFFKNDSWFFPLGNFESLSYPNKISVIYSDSIPLAAIIFKFVLKLFNYSGEFQFFGLWGLLCYILQSYFGFIISRKFFKSNILSLISGILFCLIPAFCAKMFLHTALASHWVILYVLSLLLWIKLLNRFKLYEKIFIFASVGIFCAGIHMYFIPICLILIFAYCILDILLNRPKGIKNLSAFLPLLVFAFSCSILLYVEGAFVSNIKINDSISPLYGCFNQTGHATFCFLNSIKVNPQFNSDMLDFFIPCECLFSNKVCTDNFCWIGSGIFILFLFSLFLIKKRYIKFDSPFLFVFCLVFLIFYLIAILPEIRFLERAYLKICFSESSLISQFLSIFRFNSRFNFVNIYLILIFILYIISKIEYKKASIMILLALLIQSCDLYKFINKNFMFLTFEKNNTNRFEKLDEFIFKNNVINVSKYVFSIYPCSDITIDICNYAFKNNLKLTDFYFARTFDKSKYMNYFKYKLKHSSKGDVFMFSKKYKIPNYIKCSKYVQYGDFSFCQI